MIDRKSIFFESDPELHRLCMRNLDGYRDQYRAANPQRLAAIPEQVTMPLTTDEQERLVLTLMTDELFRVAMRGALNV